MSQPVTIFVATWSDGNFDKPPYAMIEVSKRLLQEIGRLRQLAIDHKLFSTTMLWPIDWYDGDPEPFNMEGDELVVRAGDFNFVSAPRNAIYNVTTFPMTYEELWKLVADALAAGRTFACYGCTEESLIRAGAIMPLRMAA